MPTLTVDIWSDIACPWCYVGKRRFEAALATFPHAEQVAIRWRAFELDPSAPRVLDPSTSYAERLGHKYRVQAAKAQTMIDQMTATAAVDGLEFRFDRIRPGNTFDAHRLVHLALEHGKQDAMKERLFRAYLTEGLAIGQPEVLAACAHDVGLDAQDVTALLESDRHAAAVREDEGLARELGINAVPFFVLGGRLGVSGAQPAAHLERALQRAWSELDDAPATDAAMACGPDGCA